MGRKETQGWVIFVVGVLLVAAIFAGVRSGRLNLSGLNIGGSGSNDGSETGGATVPESLDWQVLCSPYDYVIQTDGVLYWAESDGHKLWASDNKTDVFDRAQTALGSGTIFSNGVTVPAMTLQDDIIIIENYLGRIKIHSNLGQWLLPQRVSDPSTAGWGSAEKGRMWFNTVEGKIKFWDGSAIQVLPSAAGGGSWDDLPASASYVFKISGSNYQAIRYDGAEAYENSSIDTVYDSVLSALGTYSHGKIHFQDGYYNFTQYHLLLGDTVSDSAESKYQIIIEGEGKNTVLRQTSSNTRLLIFARKSNFVLRDLKIEMPESNSEIGLYLMGNYGVGNLAISSYGSSIDNVFMWGGDSTHYLAQFENFFHLNVGAFTVWNSQGNALRLYNNETDVQYGNSNFYGYLGLHNSGSGTALRLDSKVENANGLNLITFSHIEAYSSSPTSNIGLDFYHVMDITVQYVLIEFNKYAIKMDGSATGYVTSNVHILSGSIGLVDGGVGINVTNAVANSVKVHVWGTASKVVIDNSNSWYSAPNSFDISLTNALMSSSYFTVAAPAGATRSPHFKLTSSSYRTPNEGQQTIGDGEFIAHLCNFTPTVYFVSATVASQFASVTAANSTHLTVAIKTDAGAAGSSQAINFYAAWYP